VLEERPTAEQLDMVAEGALDVGVVRLPVADERVAVERVLVERVVVVLPEDHPMGHHAEIDFAEIAREPFIVAPHAREPMIVNLYLSFCLAAGVGPRIVQEAPQIHTVVGLVSAGLGLALVPESMRNLTRPGVLYRPLRTDARFETALVWRRSDAPPVVEAFRATVRELLAA
jgi:DNA-binding transcriptional LysR family regulator